MRYVRATMRHPKPFDLRYIVVGNEECYSEISAYEGLHLVLTQIF
ncbi:hypothetical protein Pint_18418 [Pistacia integerrima]|uniref:Uncharacterized protein n=1 Tax=Pistacia integerrima TaxID=434235 RepID=A0ACC0YYZ6_9ROSI|nr:hypothetical protein Pint_18418 [Pistacia integerrima]